ncbi:MAG: porin family protein [Bacteroidaceae bacterium]|nr:porin family protein [Bacteroidaceae bacterium]
MNEQWIKQMQQKMADYKQPAPEVSWDAVDNAMAAKKPHKVIPFRYWMRGIAAAVVLLLITGISIRIMNRQEESPVQQTAPVNNGQITTAGDGQLQPQLTDGPTEEPQPTFMAETIIYPSKKPQTKEAPVTSVEEDSADNEEEPAEIYNAADETPVQETEQEHIEPEEQTETFFDVPIPRHNRHKSDRLMAQAYVSNAMSGSRQAEYDRLMQYNDVKQVPYGSLSSSDINTPVFYDSIRNVYNIQLNRNVRHHQPVKFGMSLRYQFNDRWSLESGLTYTLLASDITTNVNGMTSHSKQILHYLGVPLNLGYQFWTDRKLGLYVSTGGTIDKLLNGSGWQFSVNGSAGADYLLNNSLSLYAEPGVSYYFPNGSDLSTIYQDHPLNFNLTLGLRFNLK